MSRAEIASRLAEVEQAIGALIDTVLDRTSRPDWTWHAAVDALIRKRDRLNALMEAQDQ